MAKFKVGDRVRRIGGNDTAEYQIVPAGWEGVIVGLGHFDRHWNVHLWDVRWDQSGVVFNAVEPSLAPLTPPEQVADAWAIEKVRAVTKPQHVEPVAPKVTACLERSNG